MAAAPHAAARAPAENSGKAAQHALGPSVARGDVQMAVTAADDNDVVRPPSAPAFDSPLRPLQRPPRLNRCDGYELASGNGLALVVAPLACFGRTRGDLEPDSSDGRGSAAAAASGGNLASACETSLLYAR